MGLHVKADGAVVECHVAAQGSVIPDVRSIGHGPSGTLRIRLARESYARGPRILLARGRPYCCAHRSETWNGGRTFRGHGAAHEHLFRQVKCGVDSDRRRFLQGLACCRLSGRVAAGGV